MGKPQDDAGAVEDNEHSQSAWPTAVTKRMCPLTDEGNGVQGPAGCKMKERTSECLVTVTIKTGEDRAGEQTWTYWRGCGLSCKMRKSNIKPEKSRSGEVEMCRDLRQMEKMELCCPRKWTESRRHPGPRPAAGHVEGSLPLASKRGCVWGATAPARRAPGGSRAFLLMASDTPVPRGVSETRRPRGPWTEVPTP